MKRCLLLDEFQFRNGSIKSATCFFLFHLITRFNSEMVRLKVNIKNWWPNAAKVSIPKWFD